MKEYIARDLTSSRELGRTFAKSERAAKIYFSKKGIAWAWQSFHAVFEVVK